MPPRISGRHWYLYFRLSVHNSNTRMESHPGPCRINNGRWRYRNRYYGVVSGSHVHYSSPWAIIIVIPSPATIPVAVVRTFIPVVASVIITIPASVTAAVVAPLSGGRKYSASHEQHQQQYFFHVCVVFSSRLVGRIKSCGLVQSGLLQIVQCKHITGCGI